MIYFNQLKKLPAGIEKSLLRKTNQGLKILKCTNKTISITICNDPQIKKLNLRYRGKNKPTDVLSFSAEDKTVLGDIIISLETARKNCQYFGTSLQEELMFLIVHGLCHLLGHDHHKKAEETKMKKLERKVLYKLFKKNYHA